MDIVLFYFKMDRVPLYFKNIIPRTFPILNRIYIRSEFHEFETCYNKIKNVNIRLYLFIYENILLRSCTSEFSHIT